MNSFSEYNTGISIQVSLSGYSFKVTDETGTKENGWLSADKIFTTKEFQKRYESVKISLLTPKFTLVPDQFFDATSIKEELGEVTKLNPDDNVEFVRIPKYGAVLVFSNTLGETLSRTIAQTVFTSDGYQARILPEMYHMIYALEECTEYNKILASYADGYLYLLIAQGKSLLLANAFRAPDFTTAEYFIFLSMRKLQLNPEVSSICFRTPVSQEEEMSLYRYFKAVEHI